MATCEHCPSQKSRTQNRQSSKLNKTRPSQQRYAKAPKYAGQQSFDLENGLLERPVQSRKRRATDDIAQPYKRPKLWLMDCPEGIIVELNKLCEDSATEELRGYVWCNTCYASSRKSVTSDETTDENDTPSKRVLKSIQSVQDETRQLLLAIGTTEADFEIELETLRASLTPGQPCIMKQTRLVLALCKSLLSLKFGFFTLSQAPGTSHMLQNFTSRYAMPAAVWQRNLKPVLEVLRHHLNEDNREIFGRFLSMCDLWLHSLRRHVPDLKSEWDLIEENLLKYLLALKADGIGVPDSHFGSEISGWTSRYKIPEAADGVINSCSRDCYCHYSTGALTALEDSSTKHTFQYDSGDLDVNILNRTSNSDPCWSEEVQRSQDCSNPCHLYRQNFCSSWDIDVANIVRDGSSEPNRSESSLDPAVLSVYSDVVLAFLSGWLHYGSRIAQTLHAYYKVFAFCAWAGGTGFISSQI